MDRQFMSIRRWIMSRGVCGRRLEDDTSREPRFCDGVPALTRRRDLLKPACGTPLVHGYS